MWLRSVLWICLCLSLSGCGIVSEQSIYEGMRSSERAKSAGTEQQDKALPNYDAYSKERELLKK